MADAEALDAFGLVEQHVSLLPEVVLPDLLHELVLHVSRAGFAGCQDELLLQLRVLRQVAYGLPDRDYLEQTERVQGQTLMQSAKACRDDCDTFAKLQLAAHLETRAVSKVPHTHSSIEGRCIGSLGIGVADEHSRDRPGVTTQNPRDVARLDTNHLDSGSSSAQHVPSRFNSRISST